MIRLFNKKRNSADFIEGLRMQIAMALPLLAEEYPDLLEAFRPQPVAEWHVSGGSKSNWEFFMMAGGIGLYAHTRRPFMTEKEFRELVRETTAIDKGISEAVPSCAGFIDKFSRTHRDDFIEWDPGLSLPALATGIWVLENIVGEHPDRGDSDGTASAIGRLLNGLIYDLGKEFM